MITLPSPVQLTEANDGRTIAVSKGSTIHVVLASTFWTFSPPSNAAVLQQVGPPAVAHALPCIPGGGCGTVSVTYQVVGSGQATISASRTSCGEALLCTGTAGSYAVYLTVP